MKTKRFLSMVIAAAMAMQCAAFSVFAENTDTVTVVANDIDTDWTMQWNWERYEQGFDYFCDWTLTDGFSLTHNAGLHKELSDVDYALTQDKNGAYTVYNETFPSSGEYKVAFRTNEGGKAVPYNAEDTTSTENLWYHQGRSNVIAKFDVGETENNGKPIVVSFKYQSTNPATGAWVNGPATSFLLYGVGGKAIFNLYNNDSGRGFTIAGSQTKYITSAWDDKAEHTVKLVISPELTSDGRYQMTAIELDGVVTKFEDMYSSSSGLKDVLLNKICYSSRGDSGKDYTDQISNLTVVRGIKQIDVTSSVADGAKDVIPQNIELNFTDTVSLADGAVKVYENGVEMAAENYTVTLSDDALKAYVSIPEYKSRTAYKLVVDKTLVSGIYGGNVENGLEINFVSAKKVENLEGSDSNLAAGYTIAGAGYGGVGQKFTTVETDADGVTTITIDNDTWAKAESANSNKTGDAAWEYDINGDGTPEKLGYNSWRFSNVLFNNISDIMKSTEPIVISMDYSFENAGSNANDIWVTMGDKGTNMFMLTPFGEKPNVSGSSWDGTNYASGVTETEWHSVQYVIDPTLDENSKTSISQITLDDEVIKDTAGNWVSYGTSPAENEANGQYIKGMNMRVWLVKGAKDENGAYLPTVLKIKNFKVLRAKKLTAVIDTDALTSADNILNVRFSDPVSEGELANLKVMKGANIVENAISAASISEDGMSAKLTVNLDVTARYNLVISEVSDIYGVKPSTASIAFEYYNTTDGYVTIADGGVADDGTNTTVSFTFTGSKTVSPLVIAAAYDENMSLIGINTKIINLTPSAYISDSITLEKVSGAARIQLMAWDSLESIKPYCIARDFE